MSTTGNVLFSASPFVRWTLSPVLLCFAIFFPLASPNWDDQKVLFVVAFEIVALALLAGFWLPGRLGSMAFRLVAALVFIGYAVYLTSTFQAWMHGEAALAGRKSQASPLSALLGMVVIGLPALVYAWKGRFRFREDDGLQAARRAEHIKLLQQPDWQHCERLLERPVPWALRELYAEEKLLTSTGLKFSDEFLISEFLPLQAQVMPHFGDDAVVHPLIFASSVPYGLIYLVCGPEVDDSVYITLSDPGGTSLLAESMDEFLQRLRLANHAA